MISFKNKKSLSGGTHMEFYELMVKGFDEADWSQNYVSKEFNINRGILHRFYRGIGSLSRENFREIIYKIPLSYSQKTLLIESFYKDALGTDTFRRITHIGNVLKEIANYENDTEPKYISVPLTVDDPEKITFLNSSQIKMAVDYIFENAAPGDLYTNYPHSFTEIDKAAFNHYIKTSGWNIVHMINFKIDDEDGENIDNLFRAIKWVEHQCSPYYIISESKAEENIPFPCFFAADSYCILFHPKNKCGILVKNNEIFEYIKNSSLKLLKKSALLASYPKDLFELNNDCSCISGESIRMTISSQPCIAPIITSEAMDELLRDDIPGIGGIKKVCMNRYNKLAKVHDHKHIVTDMGLRNFIETGEIIECPSVLLKTERLPLKYRKQYIQLMLENVNNERLLIIDSRTFPFPDVNIELYKNHIQIFCIFQNIPKNQQYAGNGIIILNDKRLKKDIELFIEYLQVTCGIYLKNVAEEYLRSILLLCDDEADLND